MKDSNTSSESGTTLATPPMKKLKQARLPFQVITPELSKPQETKKRKLSEEKEEAPKKIIKKSIIKDFKDDVKDDNKVEEPLVISDEDEDNSKSNLEGSETTSKTLNPLVSIVDIALKRKLSKKKSPPKPKVRETKTRHKKRKVSEQREQLGENESVTKSEEAPGEETIKKVDNKENISQIILIEDSNDCAPKDNDGSAQEDADANKLISMDVEDQETVNLTIEDEPNRSGANDAPNIPDKSSDEDAAESKQENKTDLNDSKIESDEVSDSDLENVTLDTSTKCSSEEEDETKEESVLNESDSKSVVTPKSKRRERNVGSPHTPADSKKLTPKQVQKKIESAKKQQEREKERLEKLRKKQEEKEEKSRQKIEKEEQKKREREEKEEQRKKEKEEKEEQKKKEKEEKERQKELERKEREEKEEMKRKEKEEKELQKKKEREAKEEERRKKELEREEDKKKKEIEKEEAELKKKKAAAAFVNFFVPKASSSKHTEDCEPVIKNNLLSNFRIKADMRLAPLNRKVLSTEQKRNLEEHLDKQSVVSCDMYVTQVKNKCYEAGWSTKTWPLEDEDVMVVEDELPIESVDFVPEETRKQKMRAKLLSFSENRRPPYWGTWRRKSKNITGRTPFGMDSNILDYECDSDEEWEEEEPGESVGGSVAGSDDEEEDNDYDIDNDFMVPHGYLSEEEAMCDEDEVLSPESQKAKLKIMQCEFEKEMKKNTEKLHPRSIGIIWQKSDGGRPESCKESLWDFLFNKRILTEEDHIVIKPKQIVVESSLEETKSDKPSVKKSRKITDEMIPELIKLVHGNTNNRGFLAHEYQTYLAKTHEQQNENSSEEYVNVSKMSIAKKIKEISSWTSCPIEGPMFGKMCWCVSKDTFEKYTISVCLPNKWEYVLKSKKKSKQPIPQITQFLNVDQSTE